MSLRVWLPLNNGELTQQGLNNITATIMGSIPLTSTGKLGKCAYFANNCANAIHMPGLQQTSNFSWSCWFNCVGAGATPYQFLLSEGRDAGYRGINLRLTKEGTGLFVQFGDNSTIITTNTIAISLNTWYHVAVVVTDNTINVYLNGILKTTNSFTIIPNYTESNNRFVIGKMAYGYTNTTSYFCFNGYVNDVRIYDHALSMKEVKELSKGLVLHYKLDGIKFTESTVNYLTTKSTNFVGVWDSHGFGSKGVISAASINPAINGQVAMIKQGGTGVTNNGAAEMATVFTHAYSTVMNKGESFTASCYVKGNGATVGKQCRIHIYNTNGTNTISTGTNYILTGEWQRVTHTMTWTHDTPSTNSANVYIVGYMNTDESFYVSNFQVEKKDHATLFTENTWTGGIEYDCSGYRNNGRIYSYDTNGIIESSSNSPRYNNCTYINSSNNTTNTASGTKYIYGDLILTTPNQLSVAFWCKPIEGYGSQLEQGQFCLTNIDFGANAGNDYQQGPMNHRDAGVDVNDASGSNHLRISTSFVKNEWHHFVFTYDGKTARTYKDGVQTSTAAFSSNLSLGSMKGAIIGFSKAGGVWRSNKSYYSDFRIYTTALSADDVKELYQIAASIDNYGNVHAYEVVE